MRTRYDDYDDINIPNYQVLVFVWERKEDNARYFVSDISDLLCSAIEINKERNSPDTCSFSIEYVQLKERLKREKSYAQNVFRPWLTEIKIRRNFKTIFSGYLGTMRLSLSEIQKQTLTLNCFGWGKMLEKRYVSFGIGNKSYPEIAEQIITEAQHELNWIENYAFEASDDEAYLSGWAYNGSLEAPDPVIRTPEPNRLWGGGIRLAGGSTLLGPTQSAEDYAGEPITFDFYVANCAAGSLEIEFFEGPMTDGSNAGKRIGSTKVNYPSSGSTWTLVRNQITTIGPGKIHYIKLKPSSTLDISELQMYRTPKECDIYDLGIRQGVIDTHYVAPDGKEKDYIYQRNRIRHFHRQQALEGIHSLSKLKADPNDGDQFEYEFDEYKKFNVYKYQGITIADPELQLTYPGEIANLEIERNIEGVTNCIYGHATEDLTYKDAEGNDMSFTRTWNAVCKSQNSMDYLGVMEDIKSYEGVNEQKDINSKILTDLNDYGDIQEIPTITVDSNIYNPSNMHIGDAFALKVLEDEMFYYINGIYRIYSYRLSVSQDSVEDIQATLITPSLFTIKMMTFVNRYKLTEEAVRRLQQK